MPHKFYEINLDQSRRPLHSKRMSLNPILFIYLFVFSLWNCLTQLVPSEWMLVWILILTSSWTRYEFTTWTCIIPHVNITSHLLYLNSWGSWRLLRLAHWMKHGWKIGLLEFCDAIYSIVLVNVISNEFK